MKRRVLIIFFLAYISSSVCHPQGSGTDDRLRQMVLRYGQADITIPRTDNGTLDYLTRNVSVLSVTDKIIEIGLSRHTVEWFIRQKIGYAIKERADLKGISSAANISQALEWDIYPTYTQYDSIMHSFPVLFPSLCHLDTIGTSINGKLVLVLKISDNPDLDETEPEVFYSSTMHGNETGGYILMMRLADMLLNEYQGSERVRNLVDNLEIWINPLANPDGTYNEGNEINSPIRFNANGIDLNRNFPDPFLPEIVHEKETLGMMSFMRSHRFVLSANFHAGVEALNYPWDRWLSILHADNDWFYDIGRAYADTVHIYAPNGYMTDFDNGVTRGSEWYIIYGGRQDFMTQELHGREVTIELDDQLVTPANELLALWESNWRSLIGYLENALFGIHGFVLDSSSSAPVAAEIFIEGHDTDSSQVYSDTLTGSFVRLLAPGTWPLTFTSDGYRDTTVYVSVYSGQRTDIQLFMEHYPAPPDTTLPKPPALYPNPVSSVLYALLPDEVLGFVNIVIFNDLGQKILQYDMEVLKGVPLYIDVGRLSPGTYSAVFTNSKKNKSCRGRFIVIK